jgi:DNA-binding CsgD family transcriptional regulator
MVGRRAELESLLAAFDDGRVGRPRTVVVRGEAGIGKTRLVQEFLAAAPSRSGDLPLVVAVGQCVDLGPIGSPFGPIRRVLRDLHSALGTETLRAAAGSSAVIASLAALVPGIAADPLPGDDPAGGFAEAIEVLLERLSREVHLVVVVEDLQWADAATLALLKTLASTLRGRHLTIVATYRSDDIDRFHPLRPVLAELDRTRAILRVEIEPLSEEQVAEQVVQLSAAADPRDIAGLADRSGGIPFLVEELVDLGDSGLPDTLRELVLARYTRLSAPAQQVVRTMAAGGVHADHEVLAGVSTLDDRALDMAIREAIDARVILADGAGYSFRHALTREAVEGEMLPSERVRVHRAYAEFLTEHRSDQPDDASSIAEHWLAARDLPAAFDATVAALRHTRSRYSPAMSAKLAERLTELWDQVPDAATRADMSLPELHLAAALAWHDIGDSLRALRSADEGLSVCTDDPLTRAALLRQRYVQAFNGEHRERREDLLAAAELLEGRDDVPAVALLSRIMTNLSMGEHGAEAAEQGRRAVTLAEEAGDDSALAVALTSEAWRVASDEDDEPGALLLLERAATLDVSPAMRAYVGEAHVDMLARLARYDEAAIVGERRYAEAVRAGVERGSGASIAYSLARVLFSLGRPDEGLRYTRRARRLVERANRVSMVRLLSTHYIWSGEPDARDALLEDERQAIAESIAKHPEKHSSWIIDRADALVSLRALGEPVSDADERAAATSAILDLVDDTERSSPTMRRYAALSASMLLASAPDDLAARTRLAASVSAWPDRGIAPVYARYVHAMLAEAAGTDAPERAAHWQALMPHLAEHVSPVWHMQIARCSLAAALVETGEREEAVALLQQVQEEAPSQGVARVGRWAAALAAQARLVTAAPPEVDAIVALTPRERQVLELVAEGLTNPQIGRRLFISPKTASVHVSAILAKIGAANRAEAAALYAAVGRAPA